MITASILKKVYKKRKKDVHKGDAGKVLIIGGSEIYTGASVLVAKSALASLKSGVDIAFIAAPRRAADIAASYSPELITYPLEGKFLQRKHVRNLLEFSKGKDTVVIGNGLGRNQETLKAVESFLKKVNLPCVVDADGIHGLKNIKNKDFIVTPHAYEFYILTKQKLSDNFNDRKKQVKTAAKKLGMTILLKGVKDIVSDGENLEVNNTGVSEMTAGGTGDVLAGIAGGLLARGNSCFDSACAAAYINGKAGELAARKLKDSMIAGDLIEMLPRVITKAF